MIKMDVTLNDDQTFDLTCSVTGEPEVVLNELAFGAARLFVGIWQELQGKVKDDISEMLLDDLLRDIRGKADALMKAKEGETHDGD